MELLLIGNAGEDSFRTGEWSFQAAEFASLDELEIEAATRLPMEGASTVIALLRGEIDLTELEARYAGIMDDVQDNDLRSNEIDMRAWGAFAEGRFDEAASAWMEMADTSALNAPYVLPRAAGMALLARDAAHARLALDRMVATGAHGRAIDMDKTAVRAGLAALDGSTQEAIAGFRAAIAGWRDLGLPWDEAMTSLIFVRLVGTGSPEARAAAESARTILDGLGARRVVAILDGFVGDASGAAQERAGVGVRPRRDGPGGEQPGLTGSAGLALELLERRGQLGRIRRDRRRLLVGGSAATSARGRHAGQHEDAAGADGPRGREVRGDAVADHDRLARVRDRRRARRPRGGTARACRSRPARPRSRPRAR